jgi:hypothetical protein
MSDPVDAAQKTIVAPINFAKRNPIGFAVLLLLGILVLLHFSGRMNKWILARAAASKPGADGKQNGPWVKIGRWTGAIAPLTIMVLSFVSLIHDAMAGTQSLTTIGAGLLSMASAFAFPAPDYVALKDENGNYSSLLTPGSGIVERKFNFRADRETINGFPLKVTDIDFEIQVTMDNSSLDSGASLAYWDELFCMIAGIELVSPRFGTICDKNFYCGPVAKHFGEYIGNGYGYSGDEAFAAIDLADTGNVSAVVRLFVSYPIMHRCLAKPDESAMFAGWLQATQCKLNLAPSNAIDVAAPGSTILGADVVVKCGYRQYLSVGHGNPAQQFVVPPLVYRRTLLTPAAGQFDVVFPQVSATGPQNTSVKNGERLLAAVLLTDNLSLPGPGTFENVTEIGCQGLGLINTYHPEMFVRGKIPTERRIVAMPTPPIAPAPYGYTSPNLCGWPYTMQGYPTPGVFGYNLLPSLLGIAFALPGATQKISKLPRVKGDLTVHALQPTPPSSGQYALYLETLRDIDGGYAAQMLAAAGVRGQVTRHVNHNADAAVSSGARRPAQYTGMPQGTK